MIIKTKVFELYNRRYQNLSELAQAMGISVSQVYRVRIGKRAINQKFIIGAVKAFPSYKFDDLFYLTPELLVTQHRDEIAAKEKEMLESTQQALAKFTESISEYAYHLRSHTSTITGLGEASQELKKNAEKANKILNNLLFILGR